MQQKVIDFSILMIGSFLFAIGINYFAIPNMLSEGGVIGITIVTYYLFEWSPGLVNFILNIALLAIGYKFFTKKTVIYTIITIVFMSFFLEITHGRGELLGDDTLLAALFAGLFVGIGLGLIFRVGGTSGGATTLARLLNQFLGWNLGKAMLVIDITVILMSAFVIGKEKAMYTLIAVFVGAKVIDKIVEGANERIAVTIISKYQEEVLNEVINEMGRGVTIFEGRGGYTGNTQAIIYIIINQNELVHLRRILEQIDKDAYVIISNVQEIFKKGYKEQHRKLLL